jgi:hypothetical protein
VDENFIDGSLHNPLQKISDYFRDYSRSTYIWCKQIELDFYRIRRQTVDEQTFFSQEEFQESNLTTEQHLLLQSYSTFSSIFRNKLW